MVRTVLCMVAGAAMLPLASAATAQPTGSRIDNTRMIEDPVAGWRFGRCVSNFRTEAVEALLTSLPSSEAERRAVARVVDPNYDRCYTEAEFSGQQMHLDETLLRGQAAQGRYLAKYPDGAPVTIASLDTAVIPVEVYNERISSAEDQQAEVLRIFGDCVVAADAMGVDSLIRTGVTSDEEGAAIGALSAHFGPCLWEGQSIQFSAESLRAALADALYRRSEGRTVMALAEHRQTR